MPANYSNGSEELAGGVSGELVLPYKKLNLHNMLGLIRWFYSLRVWSNTIHEPLAGA
jgi:hypothetical protein